MSPIVPARSGAWLFFGLAFGWTWLFWILAAILNISAQAPSGRVLVVGGLLGPMLAGIGLASLGGESRRDYWKRVVDGRRIPACWLAAILLFAPCLMALAILVDVAAGNEATLAAITGRAAPFVAAPWTLAPFLLRVLVYGPLPEELGWRGYALDRLQAAHEPLAASLILGAVWAAWHLPLFFIRDMNPHYSHGVGSAWFWLFMAQVVAAAVVYSFVFNNTGRSTLAAIIFHFMSNMTVELTNVTDATNLYATLLWIAAAVAVASLWGAGAVTPPSASASAKR